MEDENIDIYGDLPNIELGTEIERLQNECEALNTKTNELVVIISKLNKEKGKLEKQNKILQKNMSILLNTAKLELKRKDALIKELRQEVDVLKNQKHLVDLTSNTRPDQPKRLSYVSTASQTTDCKQSLKEFDVHRRHQSPDSSKVGKGDEEKKLVVYHSASERKPSEVSKIAGSLECERRRDKVKESSRPESSKFERSRADTNNSREVLQRKRPREVVKSLSPSPERRHGSGSRYSSRDSRKWGRGSNTSSGYERKSYRLRSPNYYQSRSRTRSNSPARSGHRRRSWTRGDYHHPEESKRPRTDHERSEQSPIRFDKSQRQQSANVSQSSEYQDSRKGKNDSGIEDRSRRNGLAKNNSRSASPASKFLRKEEVDYRASYERELDSAEEGELIDDNSGHQGEVGFPQDSEQKKLSEQQKSMDSRHESPVIEPRGAEENIPQQEPSESVRSFSREQTGGVKSAPSSESWHTAPEFEETRESEDAMEDKDEEEEEEELKITDESNDEMEELNWQLAFKTRRRKQFGPTTPTLFTQRMTKKLQAPFEQPKNTSPDKPVLSEKTSEECNGSEIENGKEESNLQNKVVQPETTHDGVVLNNEAVSEKANLPTDRDDSNKTVKPCEVLAKIENTSNLKGPCELAKVKSVVDLVNVNEKNSSYLGQHQQQVTREMEVEEVGVNGQQPTTVSAQSVLSSLLSLASSNSKGEAIVFNAPSKLCSAQETRKFFQTVERSNDKQNIREGGCERPSIPGLGDLSFLSGPASQENSLRFNDPIEYTPFKNRYKLIEISPILPKPGISVLAFHQMSKEEQEKFLDPAPEKTIVVLSTPKPTKPLMPTDIIDFIVDSEEKSKSQSQGNSVMDGKQQGTPFFSREDGSLLSEQNENVTAPSGKDVNSAPNDADNTHKMNFYVPVADECVNNSQVSEGDARRKSPRKSSKPVKAPRDDGDDDDRKKRGGDRLVNSEKLSNDSESTEISGSKLKSDEVLSKDAVGEVAADFTNYRIPKLKKSSPEGDTSVKQTKYSSRILLTPGSSEVNDGKSKSGGVKSCKNDKVNSSSSNEARSKKKDEVRRSKSNEVRGRKNDEAGYSKSDEVKSSKNDEVRRNKTGGVKISNNDEVRRNKIGGVKSSKNNKLMEIVTDDSANDSSSKLKGNKSENAKEGSEEKKLTLLSRRNSRSSTDRSKEKKDVNLPPLKLIVKRKFETEEFSVKGEKEPSMNIENSDGEIILCEVRRSSESRKTGGLATASTKKAEVNKRGTAEESSKVTEKCPKEISETDCVTSRVEMESSHQHKSEIEKSATKTTLEVTPPVATPKSCPALPPTPGANLPLNLSVSSTPSLSSSNTSSNLSNSDVSTKQDKLAVSNSDLSENTKPSSLPANSTVVMIDSPRKDASAGPIVNGFPKVVGLQNDLRLSDSSQSERDDSSDDDDDDDSDSGASAIVSMLFGDD